VSASLLLAAALAVTPALPAAPAPTARAAPLRVCADPNNLPFSNRAGAGFENRIVQIVARQLGRTVEYHWQPQRRGFLRNGLNAGECDLVPGFASAIGGVGTTRPYYRSSYVFLARDAASLPSSLDDPRLPGLRIGVQLIGDDGANSPPAHALARRGMVANVRGYTVYGDYGQAAPQSAIVEALASGDVDVAVVWGPVAGYFAQGRHLALSPVEPWLDGPQWPMVFDVSMAVRKDDVALRRALDRALATNRAEVERVLAEFRVPVHP
jgi:mxaJ protein